ncbi:MAG: AAA family ATPase [Candidatus Lokiarchaeota archaeon]|nr:AAA family ATPase [Candidatus Lokiarchaeota archaeon]
MLLVLMGVPGAGKTTLSKLLAKDLGFEFYDIDDHIPLKYKEKMRNNQILSEEERDDYMSDIIQDLKTISQSKSIVTALVLFREKDRKKIVDTIPETYMFKLDATFEVLKNRLKNRKDHFFNEEILRKAFEKEEPILIDHFKINVNRSIEEIVNDIKQKVIDLKNYD